MPHVQISKCFLRLQDVTESGLTATDLLSFDCCFQRRLLPYDENLGLSAAHGSVDEVSLKHWLMLIAHDNDARFELTSLGFMNGNPVCKLKVP